MEYLKVWCSFAEIIEPLNDSERGRLFTAMLVYAESGELPEFKGNERYVWPIAKQSIDRAREESHKGRENGSKGGRPQKPEETNRNQTKPTETTENQQEPTESYKDKDKVKDKEKIKETHLSVSKEKLRFSPPTLEDVTAYCRERGNKVDAQRFIDFYASKGWRVGTSPMKDWRAALRNWERDDRGTQKVKTVSAQAYTQREYTEDELAGDAVAALMAEARLKEGA